MSINVINDYRILSPWSLGEQGREAMLVWCCVCVCGHENIFYQPDALLSPSK